MPEPLKEGSYELHSRPVARVYVKYLADRARRYLVVKRPMLTWLIEHPIIFTLILTFTGTISFIRMLVGPEGSMPHVGYVFSAWVWLLSTCSLITVLLGGTFLILYYVPDALLLYERLRVSWRRWVDR